MDDSYRIRPLSEIDPDKAAEAKARLEGYLRGREEEQELEELMKLRREHLAVLDKLEDEDG